MAQLPGLGLRPPTVAPVIERSSRTIELTPGSEWRFEVGQGPPIVVKLLHPAPDSLNSPSNDNSNGFPALTGTAEIFGTELAPNHVYEFPALTKAAIFTHHGCKMEVMGGCESEYIAEETPMNEYVNLHFALENMRSTSLHSGDGGPRVLLLGPPNSGKTCVAKILTAYAMRSLRSPLVVCLSPAESMLSLPSSVTAAVFGSGSLLDVEDTASCGWGTSPIGGPSMTPVKMPVVYQYGYSGPEEKPDIFKPTVTRLALAATSRYDEDKEVRTAGIIVDLSGSVTVGKGGTEVVSHVVSEFSINVIVVLGSERLFSDTTKRFASPAQNGEEQVHVVKLTKSGGCVDRDETYLRQFRFAQIRNYFFGTSKNPLSPQTINLEFEHLTVLRMVDPSNTMPDFLPGGAEDYATDLKGGIFEMVNPSLAMQSALFAVKYAAPTESHEVIRDAPVMGWLYVADVDEDKRRLKLLSPVGGRLPFNAIVWGPWEVAVGVGDMLAG